MSLERLRLLPENSVGRTYAAWLDREGVTPDTRDAVRYIDDEEEAYVMQRYRECHDFYHAVTGLPVWVEGELGLKAFEFANTGLPMTGLSLAAIVRLKPLERQRMFDIFLPWAFANGWRSKDLINVYWEEELETDCAELRKRLNIEQPPDLRDIRKKLSDARRAAKAAQDTAGERNATPPTSIVLRLIQEVVKVIVVPSTSSYHFDTFNRMPCLFLMFRQTCKHIFQLLFGNFLPQLT
ncbi:Ubiquinone biosynthesis protein [Exophiala sideris]|uniref:Ubiquinone biosynthesis protein n=1 Tax=Exophiala sideris TaxID=1016849 RepID=A0ABR0JSG7_9EURO|nr:Ubiquinone biosynthesis protein [Exophiala sideris]KAK5068915.1 Ubiquinone biosynthesis protein [Exophiala sideris]